MLIKKVLKIFLLALLVLVLVAFIYFLFFNFRTSYRGKVMNSNWVEWEKRMVDTRKEHLIQSFSPFAEFFYLETIPLTFSKDNKELIYYDGLDHKVYSILIENGVKRVVGESFEDLFCGGYDEEGKLYWKGVKEVDDYYSSFFKQPGDNELVANYCPGTMQLRQCWEKKQYRVGDKYTRSCSVLKRPKSDQNLFLLSVEPHMLADDIDLADKAIFGRMLPNIFLGFPQGKKERLTGLALDYRYFIWSEDGSLLAFIPAQDWYSTTDIVVVKLRL